MDKPSLKKILVHSYTDTNLSEDESIIVVTAYGIITGKPLYNDEQHSPQSLFTKEITDKYYADYAITPGTPTYGNDGYIYLKDVIIRSSAYTTELPSLVVFYDQIIGITLGTFVN